NFLSSEDVGRVIVLYIILLAFRLVLLGIFYPILRNIGYGLKIRESILVWWCCPRGAVALTLGIILESTLSEQQSPEAVRSFFLITGIVFMTMVVNSTTVGYLASALGLLRPPLVKQNLVGYVHRRFYENAHEVYSKLKTQ